EAFRARYQIGPDSEEGTEPATGRHRFFEAIAAALPKLAGRSITLDRLERYEQNILQHTQAIGTARFHHGKPTVEWKYYQYLALVFSEMYLDRYFQDPAGLRDELNTRIAQHNEATVSEGDRVMPFPTTP